MANLKENNRDQWSSKLGFVLAAAGSAVGLGNLWRFPYTAGQNGGGAFVLVYFGILLLVGFTLMLAELLIGRHTQLNAVGAYRKIRKNWGWVGGIGVLASFLILSFYSVIGGWVINYLFKAATGAFTVPGTDMADLFVSFITNPGQPIIYHGIFAFLTLAIVMGGISGGIEKYSKILMPGLFVMMIVIMLRSVTLPGASEGIRFFLMPDFSKITGEVMLAALGQVFFSLSLGMGVIITYGSYLSKDENIPQSAMIIPLVDTGVALLAGLAILPAVFALGFSPDQGPALLFIILPAVFANMPLGTFFGVIFFLLVLFAALTSSISLLEASVSYIVDEFNWNRKKTALLLGLAVFLLGIPSSLAQGVWSHIEPFRELDILDSIDFVASNIMLPLSGFLLCIFIGWIWGIDEALKEATNKGKISFKLAGFWSFLIKWVAPIAILVVFFQGLK
ncbi:Na+-dependent transporter SNF family [Clostridium aceticum]|uniref:Transporter n=1 Tax=Clostridium aceticum TaxID=84022 RepID=A0A0D8I5A7_9CLOT|nr:sodium-dependent transporter [Clostridium aceticum]AKL95851.1 Na+-dependent transporter SNF family [Clostridium aceticum]KJF25465.1 Na+-dependent transporter [Clostridium aceticum]